MKTTSCSGLARGRYPATSAKSPSASRSRLAPRPVKPGTPRWRLEGRPESLTGREPPATLKAEPPLLQQLAFGLVSLYVMLVLGEWLKPFID